MNIYLLTQTDNNAFATYDSCIVIANNAEEAKIIHPDPEIKYYEDVDRWFEDEVDYVEYKVDCVYGYGYNTEWCKSPSQVNVEYLGQYKNNLKVGSVLCANYV